MKINNGTQQVAGTAVPQETTAQAEAVGKKPEQLAADQISVGKDGAGKKIELHDPQAVDAGKVERLRGLLKSGQYQVAGMEVAKKMLALLGR